MRVDLETGKERVWLTLFLPRTESASNGTDVCREDHWFFFFFFFCGPKVIRNPVAISQTTSLSCKTTSLKLIVAHRCSFESIKERLTRGRRWHSCRSCALPVWSSSDSNSHSDKQIAQRFVESVFEKHDSESWWQKERIYGKRSRSFLRLARTSSRVGCTIAHDGYSMYRDVISKSDPSSQIQALNSSDCNSLTGIGPSENPSRMYSLY